MPTTDSIFKIKEIDGINGGSIPDWVFTSAEPLVIRGLVKQWPLVVQGENSSLALIELLKESYNGESAAAYFGESIDLRRLAYNHDITALNFSIRKSNLADLLDELASDIESPEPNLPVRYVASNIVDHYFPGLRENNDLNFNTEHFQQNPLQGADPMVGIWVGNQTISPCHFDAQNNIACCVAGTREFTLFPPDQIENLYPGPLHLNPGGQAITMVDFDAPDLARFPKFELALRHRRVTTLQPGDAIFIPMMWWHQVASLSSFNVLVNYWWNSFPKMLGQAASVLEHALLSLRHRSDEEKKAWKAIFDFYVFDDQNKAVAHLPPQAHGPLAPPDDHSTRQLRAKILNKLNR